MALQPVIDAEMATLKQLVGDFSEQGWEKAWETNVTPWDNIGSVQPPLRSLLLSSQHWEWPRQGRALVPGCGRGYDAIFIAGSLTLDTLALDIAPTAINSARKLLASSPDVSPGTVTFQEADFFALSVTQKDLFDLVYDYTFFVAIPPAKRVDWGRQMSALVKPGGFLITLMFPINPPSDDGPPFFVQPDHYADVLESKWERVLEKVPENSIPSHVGREYLMVWKRL